MVSAFRGRCGTRTPNSGAGCCPNGTRSSLTRREALLRSGREVRQARRAEGVAEGLDVELNSTAHCGGPRKGAAEPVYFRFLGQKLRILSNRSPKIVSRCL